MKNHLLIGISLLTVVQVAFAQPLKLKDKDTTFKYTFTGKTGSKIELTEKTIIDKKYEIKVRPSKQINKLVKDENFEVILTNGKEDEEIVIETKSKIVTYLVDEMKIPAVTYYGEITGDNKKYYLNCYENIKPVDDQAEAKPEKKTIECLKTEGCKSYATKDSSFELTDTPICIGKKEASIIKKKSNLQITCIISEGSATAKGERIVQVLDTKDISEVKSSDKCK